MIRLVVSDIDGTLIHTTEGRYRMPFSSRSPACGERGILFVPASGRQYRSLRRLFERVAGELYYIWRKRGRGFRPGGAGGPYCQKSVMEHGEAMALARKIVATPDCELFMSGTNTSYLCPKGEGDRHAHARPREKQRGAAKAAGGRARGCREGVRLPPRRGGDADTRLTPHFGEVFNAANRGRRLAGFHAGGQGPRAAGRLCAALGVGLGEVMAFGDNTTTCPCSTRRDTLILCQPQARSSSPLVENRCDNVAEVLAALWTRIEEKIAVFNSFR